MSEQFSLLDSVSDSLSDLMRENLLRPLLTSCDITTKWQTIQSMNLL